MSTSTPPSLPADVRFGTDEPDTIVDSLEVWPLRSQHIQGQVEVKVGELGVVTDGVAAYRDARVTGEFDIPESYSRWEDEFGDGETEGRHSSAKQVVYGPVGVNANDDTDYRRLLFRSQLVKAAVRIVTGGGRYNTSNLTGYLGIPCALVTHTNGSTVVIPPAIADGYTPEESVTPEFTFSKQGFAMDDITPL